MSIELLQAEQAAGEIEALAGVLHSCVERGASVGFVLPFNLEEARQYWGRVIQNVDKGACKLLVARLDGETVGTVQLHLETPANGRHRAEVAKLLVHPKARKRGLASALMAAVESLARDQGRSLLVLDTRTGDDAERLYTSLGWQLAGKIPAYALSTDGLLCGTTLMFKVLN